MHKHTIEYVDFNDQPRKKDVYFNLTEAELTKIQTEYLDRGGVQKVMQEAIDSGDTKKLLDFIEMLVHKSYGVKSDDGSEFDKSPELMRRFENSAYYSDLYMMLFQDEGRAGAAFIQAVMPAKLIEKAEQNVRAQGEAQAKLDAQRAAGENLQQDARSIFEQRRQERVEPAPVVETPSVQEMPYNQPQEPVQSQQYQPSSQPAYPQVQTAPVENRSDPLYPAQTVSGLDGLRVPAQAPDETVMQSDGRISRPIHEVGPGYNLEGGTAGISHDPQQ